MTEKNAQFDGSIPEMYDQHLGPLLFAPFARDLAARIARIRPRRVLEVAAGTGILTQRIRAVLPPDAELIATDLNEPMLEYAKRSDDRALKIEWKQADALELPFPDNSFDLLVCQFGVMFFPDKLRAMKQFLRVLQPGGHLLFNVWDSLEKNPFAEISHTTIGKSFQDNPPDFYKVPFGCHNKKDLKQLVSEAGFEDIHIETLTIDSESPSAGNAAIGLVRGNPVVNAIRERGTADVGEIVRAVEGALADRYGNSPLKLQLQAHVVTARKGKSGPRENIS